MKIAFYTLGCKINQFDTAIMKDGVREVQYQIVPFESPSDVYVINTCSVTENADLQSRRLVRKALRQNSKAKVVVTGCYAQTNPKEVRDIPGVDIVLGNQEKNNWLDYLSGCEKHLTPSEFLSSKTPTGPIQQPLIQYFGERTRAFVKIQDGCDARCSFCLIPRARGNSRSVEPKKVIDQVRLLSDNHYKEVVLTGVNLGFYGRDFKPKVRLSDLIRRILSETDIFRIRLSSLEPKTVTKDLLDLVVSSQRVCRHLHIPLQSGDTKVLKLMNRHYSPQFYRRLIEIVQERIDDVCIGTDVMVGFPGEGERGFQNTYNLLRDLPVSYFHVFPYSKRPETPASNIQPQINELEKKSRAQKLRELGEIKRTSFYSNFPMKKQEVLIEWGRDPKNGFLRGFTSNYLRVFVQGPDEWKNQIIPVILKRSKDSEIFGIPTRLPLLPLIHKTPYDSIFQSSLL